MDDHGSNVRRDNQVDADETFHLGVLFVHGIGAQRRGQTLAEFGGPVYRWLADRLRGLDLRWREASGLHPQGSKLRQWRDRLEDWATDGFQPADDSTAGGEGRAMKSADLDQEELETLIRPLASQLGCDTVVARASLTDALVTDPSDPVAPAHAKLRIQRLRVGGDLETERWLLAESWWAETFSPPGFAELARWGIRIIPWTVGSHFGAQVRRVLEARPDATAQSGSWQRAALWLGWTARLLGASLKLIAGILVSPLLLAALAVMMLVAVVPIPQLREALLKVQLKIASTLGDSYVLLSRPIEAAAIVGQVRRDTGWLAARCQAVVVVAHSQGGAIAHQVLQAGVPEKQRLLFTFGSGLKKLEQLKFLLASGRSYVRSGIMTLVALPIFALTLVWFIGVAWLVDDRSELLHQIPIMLGYTLVSLIFLIAGVRDYVGRIDLPDLRRWVQRIEALKQRSENPFDWVDCYATADPVSNGILLEDAMVAESSEKVRNLGSISRDHTTYWENRDQFLTLLIRQLARPDLREVAGLRPAPELTTDPTFVDWVAARRRWRVRILSAIGWVAAFAVLVAVQQAAEAWLDFLIYWGNKALGWASALVGAGARPAPQMGISWPALGYLALALVPYWLARRHWRKWNRDEMRLVAEGRLATAGHVIQVYLLFQVLIAAGVLYGGVPPFWLFLVVLAAVALPIVLTEPASPGEDKEVAESVSAEIPQSKADRLWKRVVRLGLMLMLPFSLGWAGWDALVWLSERYLGDGSFGFAPGQLPGEVVGLLVVVLWVAVVLWSRRRSSQGNSPSPPED